MRLRLLVLLLALVTASAAVAQMFPFPGPGRPGAAGGSFSLTAQGSAGSFTTGTTTVNYGTVSYGSGCNAVIAVVQWYPTATGDTVSSLTIGGNSTTSVVSATAGTIALNTAIRQWSTPSGSSGTVSVTFSGNSTWESSVSLWCLISGNTTVSNTNTAGGGCNNSGTPLNASVTVPTGGTAIVAGQTFSASTISWTNATQDGVVTTNGVYQAWAHTTSTGSVSVTQTPSGGDNCVMALASWGP